jgi:hypothetical protein
MNKTFFNRSLRVSRSTQEYFAPSMLVVFALLLFYLNAFISKHDYHQFAAGFFLILTPVYALFFIYKFLVPIMRSDGRCIVVYPSIFKKAKIEPSEVKVVRVFKYAGKARIRRKQLLQCNTILIEFKNGTSLTLRGVLVEPINDRLASFLREFGLNLEIITFDK